MQRQTAIESNNDNDNKDESKRKKQPKKNKIKREPSRINDDIEFSLGSNAINLCTLCLNCIKKKHRSVHCFVVESSMVQYNFFFSINNSIRK